MPQWTIGDLVRGMRGALVGGRLDAVVTGVSIDSRTTKPRDAFFAIRGPRHDGHAFVGGAFARGAGCAVVTHLPPGLAPPADLPVVLVDDTTQALARFAAYHRGRYALPVVAITGSNGKTTTKDLAATVLARRYRVLRAESSYNNQWGVSLTLLGLESAHEAVVVELGMNAFGEIAALAELVQPTVGVVTTVGPAHLEGVGSLDGVQRAKGELVEAVPPEGLVILNADDPRVSAMATWARAPVMTYGQAPGADVRVGDVTVGPGGLAFTVSADGAEVPVRLPLAGRHNAWNAGAAVAVGRALEVPLAEAAEALARATAVKGRLVWREVAGVCILDDTYNANPVSLRAALDALRDAGDRGRVWVVLGDMLELGPHAEAAHREAGRWVAELPAAGLVTAGRATELTASVARAHGCPEVVSCGTAEEAATRLAERVAAGDRVLVKGSRGMRMERAVEAILARLGRGMGKC